MRTLAAGLLSALLGWDVAAAQAPPSPVMPALDAFVQPRQLVKLPDGRRIHLYCQGKGSPTVILTAGLGSWTVGWARVQPDIASRTRVCAWDRAGFGHSDPSPLPQTVANTTADLEAALAAAKIKGPYVMVGHSAGAFETLLFTDRHRPDVVGMVLVDGSVPTQAALIASVAPDVSKTLAATGAQNATRQRACAADVERGALKPDQPQWATCFRYFPEFSPTMVEFLKRQDTDPARLRTKASLSENFNANGDAVADASRNYGDLPLVVLTQGGAFASPAAPAEQVAAFNAGWIAWHDDYAKLSTRGINLIVRGAGHVIQLDKPQAVIGAVDSVVSAAQRQ